MPDNVFDPAYRWWRHERLHRLALRDHPASLARFVAERRPARGGLRRRPAAGEEAFETADAAEERWLADLRAADLPDRRPAWLRRQWNRTDRAARIRHEVAA